MKKRIALALALVLIVSLSVTGCGNNVTIGRIVGGGNQTLTLQNDDGTTFVFTITDKTQVLANPTIGDLVEVSHKGKYADNVEAKSIAVHEGNIIATDAGQLVGTIESISEDGNFTLKAADGNTYTFANACQIFGEPEPSVAVGNNVIVTYGGDLAKLPVAHVCSLAEPNVKVTENIKYFTTTVTSLDDSEFVCEMGNIKMHFPLTADTKVIGTIEEGDAAEIYFVGNLNEGYQALAVKLVIDKSAQDEANAAAAQELEAQEGAEPAPEATE